MSAIRCVLENGIQWIAVGEEGRKRRPRGRKRPILTDTGGRSLKVYVHPTNRHDQWGGKALLEGIDLSLWPRVRQVCVDWGYRGLGKVAQGLGLKLEVLAHPFYSQYRNPFSRQ